MCCYYGYGLRILYIMAILFHKHMQPLKVKGNIILSSTRKAAMVLLSPASYFTMAFLSTRLISHSSFSSLELLLPSHLSNLNNSNFFGNSKIIHQLKLAILPTTSISPSPLNNLLVGAASDHTTFFLCCKQIT